MTNDLRDILGKRNPAPDDGAGQQTAEAPPAEPKPEQVGPPSAEPTGTESGAGILERIESIELEAVVNGALQKIRFKAGTNPAQVGNMLRQLDPQCQIRDAFPTRGGGGSRETKQARVLVITARVTDSGAFIDLTATTGQEDITIAVSKRNSSTFLDTVKGLGKLSEANTAKLAKAFEAKTTATIVLPEPEQIGAKFWTADDGRHYMDSIAAEPPKLEAQADE